MLLPALLAWTAACNSPAATDSETSTSSSSETSATATTTGTETGTTETGTSGDPLEGIERDEGFFHNFDQGIECVYAETLRPETREQVQAVVAWAASQGTKVKVVSSPLSHSENEIICPDESGIQINVSKMNQVLELDAEARTIKVEPGIQMGAMGDALAEAGLAMRIHLPLRDFTAAGIIATGAHNSSLVYPAGIHDSVVGLEIIDGAGELRTLTGDDARHAAVHLGWLGAVVSVTFEAVPMFKTAYSLEKGDDANLEDEILDLAAAHDYVSFSWFPAQAGYSMGYHDIVPVDTPGDANSTSWHSSPAEQLGFVEVIALVSNDPNGEETICSVEASRLADKAVGHEENGMVVEAPVGFVNKMFQSTCVDLECPWHAGGQAFNPELAIPAEQLPAWINRVKEINAAKPTCFPINGIVIRFSKGSDSWMGSNAGADVAYVEWHIPRHPDPAQNEHFSDMYDEIFQMTLEEFDARPHWAKNYWSTFAGLDRSKYAGWDQFDALRADFDPQGLFVNPFSELSYGDLPLELEPGCAIDRSCICEDDSHCGVGHECVPGLVFTDARVCR